MIKQHILPSKLSDRFQQGVNLIEIMVAMTIGLFLVLGATTLYINTKKTSDVDDTAARLQETARYAMSIMEADVRMASYWGFNSSSSGFVNKNARTTIGASNSSNYCGADYATDVNKYIEATNTGYLSHNGSILTCPAKDNTASTTADSLTVRRVIATDIPSTPDGNKIQVCSTRGALTLIKSSSATCTNGEIRDLITNGYYINQHSDQDNSTPSLRRQTLSSGPSFIDTEIITGVEDMQIELGWDNGTGPSDTPSVVRYVSPNDLPTTGRIVSVRVWLLVRSDKQDMSFTDDRTYSYADRSNYAPNDHFRRILIAKTIFIRNA